MEPASKPTKAATRSWYLHAWVTLTRRPLFVLSRVVYIVVVVAITIFAISVRDELAGLGRYGYLGVFIIQLIGSSSLVIPIPTPIVSIVGGTIYNPIWIGVVAGTAATCGEMVSYLTGRLGTPIVENRARYDQVKSWMHRNDLLVLFLMAFIPNPLFDIAGLVAGVLNIPAYRYFLVTLAGEILKFIFFAYLGTLIPGILELF